MHRPLSDWKIGISISESEDMEAHGLREEDIAPLVVTLAKRLVALGAAVVLGHQWRPNGIMDSIVSFAQSYYSESGAPKRPIIYSLLAAPDKAQISDRDRKALRPVLHIEDSISAAVQVGEAQRNGRRRKNLTYMRDKMAEKCDARICLGGKLIQRYGRSHGVIEEAVLSMERNKPVYFCGLLKGATNVLMDVFKGGDMDDAFRRLSPKREEVTRNGTRCNDETKGYLRRCRKIGFRGVCERAGISETEATELFHAQTTDNIVSVVARALRAKRR